MAPPLRILVCGGGLAGPSLAFWLTRVGCDVTVVERTGELRASGQQIDIRAQGVTAMRKMGIEPAIRAHVVDEPGMQAVDRNGKPFAFFEANKTGKGRQNMTSEFEIMRGDFCRILHDATKDETRYIFGVHVTDFEPLDDGRGVSVRFSDGTQEAYDLLVGADGQSSKIRRLMLSKEGREDELERKGLNLAWFSIPAQEGDSNALTLYASPGRRWTLTRQDKPEYLRVYYMASTTGISEDHPLQRCHRGGTVEEQKMAWADYFRGTGWQSERFIRAMDSPAAEDFYACEALQVKLDSYSRGRVTLVGDAASCASPLSGMGTGISLVGAYCLAGEIARHCKLSADGPTEPGRDPREGLAAGLKAYEETVRPFVDKAQQLMPGVPDIFMPKSQLGVSFLNWLLWLMVTLRIDKLATMLSSDDIGGWELPEYPELGSVQVT